MPFGLSGVAAARPFPKGISSVLAHTFFIGKKMVLAHLCPEGESW